VARIHLSYLDQRIQALEKDKVAFVVAENYHELRKSADELSEQIARDTNTSFLLRATVENIEISIREQPDLPIERLHALYGELTQNFKPEALKRLEDVADFHKRMLANRIARLSREKLKLLDSLKLLELDKRMQTLGETRALDQYTALVSQISDLKAQAQKLRDYQAMEREYSDKEAGLKVLMSEEVVATNAYLDETKLERERNFRVFSDFAAEFYPNKIAGISVHNNTGDNLIRFDIAVHIENDTSDGINEVRIFCYDLTLLTLRMGHRINFVFHDSRLFANMDVRQRAVLFKLAHRVTKKNGLQYIATLNPDFISGMESEFQPEELKEIIVDNIVLELKDSSPEDKLLGINVDMNYE
jgi:uncharacterized protein YydD (DUF2326 family)